MVWLHWSCRPIFFFFFFFFFDDDTMYDKFYEKQPHHFYNKSDHSLVAADVTILYFTLIATCSIHIVKLKKNSLVFKNLSSLQRRQMYWAIYKLINPTKYYFSGNKCNEICWKQSLSVSALHCCDENLWLMGTSSLKNSFSFFLIPVTWIDTIQECLLCLK